MKKPITECSVEELKQACQDLGIEIPHPFSAMLLRNRLKEAGHDGDTIEIKAPAAPRSMRRFDAPPDPAEERTEAELAALVQVRIPRSMAIDLRNMNAVPVGVNGRQFTIMPGQVVQIPLAHYFNLCQALKKEFHTDDVGRIIGESELMIYPVEYLGAA